MAGWYDTDWLSRFKVTIDKDKVYADGDYSVLIAHDNMPSHFWDNVQDDGEDIVITEDDGVTKIDRDVVIINTTDEALAIRFMLTLSTAADSVVYVYYNNPLASETNSTDAYPATLELYIGFDECGAGVPASFVDRTSNGNDMTPVSIIQNAGQQGIGYAMSVDGSNDYAYADDAASLDITDDMTVMVWVRSSDASPDSDEWILTKYKTSDGNRSWGIRSGTSSGALYQVYVSDDGSFDAGHRKNYESSVTAIENAVWHHLAFTFDTGTLKLIVDGVEDSTPTKTQDDAITSIHSGAAEVVVSADGDHGSKWGTGYFDELMIFSEVLTPNEIKTYYMNVYDTANFYGVTEAATTAAVQLNVHKINGVFTAVQS